MPLVIIMIICDGNYAKPAGIDRGQGGVDWCNAPCYDYDYDGDYTDE